MSHGAIRLNKVDLNEGKSHIKGTKFLCGSIIILFLHLLEKSCSDYDFKISICQDYFPEFYSLYKRFLDV